MRACIDAVQPGHDWCHKPEDQFGWGVARHPLLSLRSTGSTYLRIVQSRHPRRCITANKKD